MRTKETLLPGSDKDLNSETVSNAILSQKKFFPMHPVSVCRRGEKKLTKKDQFQLKKHYAEIIQNTFRKCISKK
jgi:hypothetical protein